MSASVAVTTITGSSSGVGWAPRRIWSSLVQTRQACKCPGQGEDRDRGAEERHTERQPDAVRGALHPPADEEPAERDADPEHEAADHHDHEHQRGVEAA